MSVKDIIQQVKDSQKIDWEESFIEQELFDSLEIMTLVERLENEFGCTIKGADIVPENFETVALIEELVKRNGGKL